MIFTAYSDGVLDIGGQYVRCAFGATGLRPSALKREGDGATPIGRWPMRRLLYRPDRGRSPPCRIPVFAIRPDDGWCDAASDPNYNRDVRLPYAASAEALWRQDHLYDLLVVLGHNDNPAMLGAGSAIFLHLAAPDFAPTRGCVAVDRPDMESLLALTTGSDILAVHAGPAPAQI